MGGTEIDVEELMGSRGRIRVLRVLAEAREMNISEVGRRTGMNYTSVERHLEALRELGLLREKRYGKIRIYEAMFNSVTIRFERDRGVRVDVESPKRF
ncbi:MAG: winged helix-turn-helix domain-containing protein [Candidatus Bathyarchaeia archaeon]